MDSYRILEFVIGLMAFLLILTLVVNCSHREPPKDDCCKAEFKTKRNFKVQAKHIWKKEF